MNSFTPKITTDNHIPSYSLPQYLSLFFNTLGPDSTSIKLIISLFTGTLSGSPKEKDICNILNTSHISFTSARKKLSSLNWITYTPLKEIKINHGNIDKDLLTFINIQENKNE